jgi:polar amino acid transport system substrate-binding protein
MPASGRASQWIQQDRSVVALQQRGGSKMKWKYVMLAALLVGLLAAACAPAATPAPTEVPAPTDPTWDRIQATGKMLVGTSGDYRPFAYYNENFVLTGFDVALIEAVAMRMGVPVEVKDFAFDGLGTALSIGQIDGAIAAISVTEERQALVDFTNVYFIGAGAALAKQGSGIGPISSLEQLVQYRVGVQDASVYQTEMEDLVELGQMPAANLIPFVRVDDGTRALQEGAVDILLLDDAAAQSMAAEGKFEIAGTGVVQQRYAIAVPKGSPTLLANINQALVDLNNDGTLAQLIQEYLNIAPEDQVPPPTATPTAAAGPTATPAPTRTPAPGACVDGMAYVADLNFDDENMKDPPQLDKGENFSKGWRIRNVGTCTWTNQYSLRYVFGNVPEARMDGETTHVSGQVAPNQTYDMYVDLEAPDISGTFQGFWQMFNGNGQAFGETIWVGIEVPGEAKPEPTKTPAPEPTKVPEQPPTIQSFEVDPGQVFVGECVDLSWSFSGTSIADAWITRNTETVFTDIPSSGSEQDCGLSLPGTYVYSLKVSSEFAGTTTRDVAVEVQDAGD